MKKTNSVLGGELPILLFDGECKLCNWWVSFVLAYESEPVINFVTLQSQIGRTILEYEGLSTDSFETVLFIDGDEVFIQSDAALRITGYLRLPWRWLLFALAIPKPLRDLFYKILAKHRFRLFGKVNQCYIPDSSNRSRFLF